ncbi:hypothetical protein BDV95DRAFT_597416 [Massariosphaeria phaeospora]|uniref:Uncharacterized protein n=1 Tax=Massariosphaeria phaeospora TaxID=100035 RepID=A0A7C8MIP9_9PLEO|nr:hypothetical protein BDV95DRAFT_597416 [Massariosphaeria phaeospora]
MATFTTTARSLRSTLRWLRDPTGLLLYALHQITSTRPTSNASFPPTIHHAVMKARDGRGYGAYPGQRPFQRLPALEQIGSLPFSVRPQTGRARRCATKINYLILLHSSTHYQNMSARWYCCGCGDGPHSTTLMVQCHCGHMRCSCCTVQTDHTDTGSDIDAHSDCSEEARQIPNLGCTSSHSTPFTALTAEGVKSLTSLPADTPTSSIPLTRANLAAFSDHHDGYHTHPTTQGEREFRWYCCYCGYSYNSYTYNSACTNTNCQHPICSGCVVEEIIRK